jgi:DNA-binding response OmpR family regulator
MMRECLISSELVSCPSIGTRRIYRNDESGILIVDSLIIKFTPIEYQLLLSLLSGHPVADSQLAREAFSCELDRSTQKRLNKHIDKIRNKLQLAGLSIHRVSRYGYLLLAAQS